MNLAARVIPGALPRTAIGCEMSSSTWYAGAMRPLGLSLLPIRPLRLRPIAATAGGRASATPGADPHQLAAVTPTGRGPRRNPRHPAALSHKAGPKLVASGVIRRGKPQIAIVPSCLPARTVLMYTVLRSSIWMSLTKMAAQTRPMLV